MRRAAVRPTVSAALGAAFSSRAPKFSRVVGTLAAALVVACQPIEHGSAAVDDLTPPPNIGVIQGRNARSPYEGQVVETQGVVTGNFVTGLGGFFLQDAAGAADRDPRTSDALFVVWPKGKEPRVRRGDRVKVSGRIVESGEPPFTLTTLEADTLESLGRGGVEATPIEDAPAHVRDWEALEGMWLRFTKPLTVSGHENLFQHGELRVALGSRPWRATDLHPPGPKAQAVHDDNQRRSLFVDDNRLGAKPRKIWYLDDVPNPEAPLRAGSRLHGVEGVLDSRFGGWRVQLTARPERIEQSPRPALPALPEGLRLASVNLHNLFNGKGDGRNGFPTPRGAASAAEFARQRAKLVELLVAIRPDIVAFSEAENDGEDGLSAVDDLLGALNQALGEDGDYAAVMRGRLGVDVIRVDMAFRTGRVTPLGDPQSLSVEPFDFQNRQPLAQSFRIGGDGAVLTVVANHFKSKGGCEKVPADDASNRDLGDLQGCWNGVRVTAARTLDRWMKTDPTGSGSSHTVLLGDFNSYTFEDPMRLLRSLGWRDPLPPSSKPDHHSFVFQGQAGNLDHALVSASVLPAVSARHVWPVNSDENAAFDYRGAFPDGPWGASDHDPLILVLDPAKL